MERSQYSNYSLSSHIWTLDGCQHHVSSWSIKHYFKRIFSQKTSDSLLHFQFLFFVKSWLHVSLWTPRPSPQLGVILTTITHCNVTARQRNTWYGLCAAFLNAARGDRRYCRPLSKRGNEISLHAVSHYTPQEVNAIIRITRHLGSRGGVETKIPLLHECRHKAQCAPDPGQCCKSCSKKKKGKVWQLGDPPEVWKHTNICRLIYSCSWTVQITQDKTLQQQRWTNVSQSVTDFWCKAE